MNEQGIIHEDHKIHITVQANKPWQLVDIKKICLCHKDVGYMTFDELVEKVWNSEFPQAARSSRTERREHLFSRVRNNTGMYQLRYEGHIIEPEYVRLLQSRVHNLRGKVMKLGAARPLDKSLIRAQRNSCEVVGLRNERKKVEKERQKLMKELRELKQKRQFNGIISDAISNQASEALRTNRYDDEEECYGDGIFSVHPYCGPIPHMMRPRRRHKPSQQEINNLLDAVKFVRNNRLVVLSEKEFDDLTQKLLEAVK